jgi:hypothetical protein
VKLLVSKSKKMVFIIRDPILTYFNSLSTSFRGFGVNLNLIADGSISTEFDTNTTQTQLPFKFCRVLIGTQDPTIGALNNTVLSDMDTIYSSASFSTDGTTTNPSTAELFFNQLKNTEMDAIFTFIPPQSWLDIDGYLSGELALNGFANYIISGILWIRSFQMDAQMIELFPHPKTIVNASESIIPKIHPADLVILANRLLTIADIRISADAPNVQILAPGLSSIISITDNTEPYTDAFYYGINALDYWSIHGIENEKDANIYNNGSFTGRNLMRTQLNRSLALMNAVNITLQKMITAFSTRAIKFIKSDYNIAGDTVDTTSGLISPTNVNTSLEYGLRNIDNICNCLNNGVSNILFNDYNDLISSDGTLLPTGKIASLLMSKLTIPGNIFVSEEINRAEDFTIKSLIMSSNSERFTFILCRPVVPDLLLGRLRLTINNPLWNTQYSVTDLQVTSYPDAAPVTTTTTVDAFGNTVVVKQVGQGVDLSNVFIKPSVYLGSMSLFVKGVPYGGCVILISGTMTLNPPNPTPTPDPTPTPTPGEGTPITVQTIMQIPVNYGSPSLTSYTTGTVFYDSQAKILKTWNGSAWIPAPLLMYV